MTEAAQSIQPASNNHFLRGLNANGNEFFYTGRPKQLRLIRNGWALHNTPIMWGVALNNTTKAQGNRTNAHSRQLG
jgi:hypothetical protein